MKTLRKLLAVLFLLTLCVSLCVTAYADDTYYGDGETVQKTYSVEQYFATWDAAVANGTTGITNETTLNKINTLVHALADYGHYVQIFLDEENAGWGLGEGADNYRPLNTFYTQSYDYTTVGNEISDTDNIFGTNLLIDRVPNSDIQSISYQLKLDSETAIRVYFKPAAGYTGSLTATLNGEPVTAAKQTDGRWMVEIKGISAHLLGTRYNIVATTDIDTNPATVGVTALSYVASLLTASAYNNKPNARNGVCALYYYAKAAKQYGN